MLLRLDDFNMKQACQNLACLTINTNDDCNLNEFYTEEITAVLRSKLQRKKKRKTMNFVCLASAENERVCSGGKKNWGEEITINSFLNAALKELS